MTGGAVAGSGAWSAQFLAVHAVDVDHREDATVVDHRLAELGPVRVLPRPEPVVLDERVDLGSVRIVRGAGQRDRTFGGGPGVTVRAGELDGGPRITPKVLTEFSSR